MSNHQETDPEQKVAKAVDRTDENGAAPAQPFHHDGENRPADGRHEGETLSEARVQSYWTANVRLLLSLLAIWFVVSFGAGILFVDTLNTIRIGGFPLGFWFAQQGSILVFVALIFFYARRMTSIEKQFGVDDAAEGAHHGS